MPTKRPERVVDARKRISLAGIVDHDRYWIEKASDGTILLTPIVSVAVTTSVGTSPTLPARQARQRREVEPRFRKGVK